MKLSLLFLIPLFHFGAADQGHVLIQKIRIKVADDAYPGTENKISNQTDVSFKASYAFHYPKTACIW